MTLVESQKVKSDAQGRFVLKSEGQDLHVVVAESVIDGTTHAAASQPLWIGQSHPIERQQRSLVVTDRAIYRPGQTIHYKAIAYHFHSAGKAPAVWSTSRARRHTGVKRCQLAGNCTTHTTNAFGSCAGTFTAPSRTLLGAMTIVAETDAPGATAIRVEEYKRPKFKVEIDSPQVPVVLEGQVTLTGKATTYTGIPVVGRYGEHSSGKASSISSVVSLLVWLASWRRRGKHRTWSYSHRRYGFISNFFSSETRPQRFEGIATGFQLPDFGRCDRLKR